MLRFHPPLRTCCSTVSASSGDSVVSCRRRSSGKTPGDHGTPKDSNLHMAIAQTAVAKRVGGPRQTWEAPSQLLFAVVSRQYRNLGRALFAIYLLADPPFSKSLMGTQRILKMPLPSVALKTHAGFPARPVAPSGTLEKPAIIFLASFAAMSVRKPRENLGPIQVTSPLTSYNFYN